MSYLDQQLATGKTIEQIARDEVNEFLPRYIQTLEITIKQNKEEMEHLEKNGQKDSALYKQCESTIKDAEYFIARWSKGIWWKLIGYAQRVVMRNWRAYLLCL